METPKEAKLTTEEELAEELWKRIGKIRQSEARRLVDLIIDLIAERSEEKAQEVLEEHNLDHDHGVLYGGT